MAASKTTVNKAKSEKTATPAKAAQPAAAKAAPAPVKAAPAPVKAAPAPAKAAAAPVKAAPAPAKAKAKVPPTELEIRTRAYEIYVSEGCQEGRDMEYWLRAETDLRQQAN